MYSFDIGRFVGMIAAVIAVPLLLLVIFKLTGALRQRPALQNGIPGAIAVLFSFVPVSTPLAEMAAVAVIMAAIFYWQYVRDVKALAKAVKVEAPSRERQDE